MNSLFKSANIIYRNKQSLQFLKKSIGMFNFSTINKVINYTTLSPILSNSSNLVNVNKKYFWKKEEKKDKPAEKGVEPTDSKKDQPGESEDKPPKGFEKFHRKKKDDQDDKKDEQPNNNNDNKNNDEDPNKGS
jgi:hypothetical protein